ncbi:MAG: ATP synthase subunit I [Acidimicrobiia bacterium]|nr:ATP synthase subunit I [Acidimicrobiia bacterium]
MDVENADVAVESVLARHTVARAAWVAPVLIAIFWLTGGWQGAWSSALGVIIVIANFLLFGAILSISARISLQAYHAAALIGFVLRLGLFVGLVYLISVTVDVDRLAFGITAVVAYLALLVLEAVAVSKGKERELTWTN